MEFLIDIVSDWKSNWALFYVNVEIKSGTVSVCLLFCAIYKRQLRVMSVVLSEVESTEIIPVRVSLRVKHTQQSIK